MKNKRNLITLPAHTEKYWLGECVNLTTGEGRTIGYYDNALDFCAAVYHIQRAGRPMLRCEYYSERKRYEACEVHHDAERGEYVITHGYCMTVLARVPDAAVYASDCPFPLLDAVFI